MVLNGATGKKRNDEILRILNVRTNDVPLKDIVKVIHVMSALILQKRSETSKAKDHLKALERRLRLWEEGNITELVSRSEIILDVTLLIYSTININ